MVILNLSRGKLGFQSEKNGVSETNVDIFSTEIFKKGTFNSDIAQDDDEKKLKLS